LPHLGFMDRANPPCTGRRRGGRVRFFNPRSVGSSSVVRGLVSVVVVVVCPYVNPSLTR
jgi:hypothetical protein